MLRRRRRQREAGDDGLQVDSHLALPAFMDKRRRGDGIVALAIEANGAFELK